jgi:hypothetical protein
VIGYRYLEELYNYSLLAQHRKLVMECVAAIWRAIAQIAADTFLECSCESAEST